MAFVMRVACLRCCDVDDERALLNLGCLLYLDGCQSSCLSPSSAGKPPKDRNRIVLVCLGTLIV